MKSVYRSPVLLDDTIDHKVSTGGAFDSVRNMKEDMATSFVYGDDSYEEEYIVPDVMEEVVTAEPAEAVESAE